MTKEKELYIKDKKIITELVGDTMKYYNIFFIASLLCFVTCIFLQFFGDNDSAAMLTLMGTDMMILYFIFAVHGITPDVKIAVSSARESVNGSPLQLDTLSCIPIRKVNVLLYQYSIWRRSALVIFIDVAAMTVAALMGRRNHLCYTYIFLAVSYFSLIILYLSAFSIVFHNKILNKVTFWLTGVFYAVLMIGILTATILMEFLVDFCEPSNIFVCGFLAFAVLFQIAAELIFRKCILIRENNGWYD